MINVRRWVGAALFGRHTSWRVGLCAAWFLGLPAMASELPVLGQQVSVRLSGFTFARAAGTYNTVATVSNASQLTFMGGLRLVVTGLSPATASVTGTLAFRNPSAQPIRLTHRVEGLPDGFAPVLTLALGTAAARPGAPIDLRWQTLGKLPAGAALQLRAVAPVVVSQQAGPVVQWYLNSQSAWVGEPTAVQSPPGRRSQQLTLPANLNGLWQLQARLVDADGRLLTTASRALLVADKPGLRLRLSRPFANTADPVRVLLTLAAGYAPQPVRLMAWIVMPDGTQLGLPDLQRNRVELYQGPSIDVEFALLERAFASNEHGYYRVHAGLYDAAGQLLAHDNAAFRVCDTLGLISGNVRDSVNAPVDGLAVASATVSAVDLDDGATAGFSALGSNGAFELRLPAGRYMLTSTIMDSALTLRGNAGPVTLGCAGQPVAQDLMVTAP